MTSQSTCSTVMLSVNIRYLQSTYPKGNKYILLYIRSPSDSITFSDKYVVVQMEICMNDFRTTPAKYKSVISKTCNFDTAMVPITPGGTRLALRGTGTTVTSQLDTWGPRIGTNALKNTSAIDAFLMLDEQVELRVRVAWWTQKWKLYLLSHIPRWPNHRFT